MAHDDELHDEYETCASLYGDYSRALAKILEDVLSSDGFSIHSIRPRTKSFESCQQKLRRLQPRYHRIRDLYDLAGVRIITHFADEVDAVSQVVRREFAIDRDSSVDKRMLLDPDRFGYLSVHYAVSLPAHRAELGEYSRFADLRGEIQIRSILQHAWAEIEHDLGYKSKHAIPPSIRRRFSRLAGLLEIGDIEFTSIREELRSYGNAVITRIEREPKAVSVNRLSLTQFVRSNGEVLTIDKEIASMTGAGLRFDESYIQDCIEELAFLEVSTISELSIGLSRCRHAIGGMAKQLLGGEQFGDLWFGVSIHYLCYALVCESNSQTRVREYLDRFSIGSPSGREALAEDLLTAWKRHS